MTTPTMADGPATRSLPEYLRDVTIAWDRLGDVQLAMGQTGEALQSFKQSMDITRQLAQRSPDARATSSRCGWSSPPSPAKYWLT